MAERRVIAAGDYLAGEFNHLEETDRLARTTGIGDLIVAPIIGDEGPLGAIEVYRRERHAFDEMDAAVLGGLADQAAIAITNAHLILELERSQAAVARRAETERALREITAGIAALREPEVILDRVVEEARRLLGTDGAHLTRMGEDGTYLVPVVVAGAIDARTKAWLLEMRFPLGGGINGLAAELGEPVLDERLHGRPAHPARGQRRRGRREPRAVRHGRRAAARAGRRGHRDARDLVADAAQLRRRGTRPAPGPRRPGRHRDHQLDPADPAARFGDPLPDARLVVAGSRLRDRRRRQLDVPQRPRSDDARLGHRGHGRRITSARSWPTAGSSDPTRSSPSSSRTRRRSTPRASTSRAATAGRRPGRDQRHRAPRGRSPVGDPRRRPRRLGAGAAGARPAGLGGALPQPRPDDAGRHLPLRRGRAVPVHGRGFRGALRLDARRRSRI